MRSPRRRGASARGSSAPISRCRPRDRRYDHRPVSTFPELVSLAVAAGGFGADDAINATLTLFDDVEAVHDEGLVAALRGIDALVVDDRFRVHLAAGTARSVLVNHGKVAQVQPNRSLVDADDAATTLG